ncbi:hypothetical protein BvCmsOUNP049_02182 [Escherichia coli]|nr:hypothetical protein BvCmsKSP045_02801 [Escherichia coli]GDR74720.1 hypothetical protein BvCmsSINP011_02239 [Escherichia coli]GDT79070.1 hypothetical protein BvCmsOUNP049_02182 [Escherichia coli]GEH24900.1 hypothetical protein EC141115_00663 [Escherichia coli O145:H28]
MQQIPYWLGSLFVFAFLMKYCISNELVGNESACASAEKNIPLLVYENESPVNRN